MDVRTAIGLLVEHRDLSESDMESVMREVMGGGATAAQLGALLVALHMKGERVEELTGATRAMRRYATRVPTDLEVVDTCGTGGDLRRTFNISTAAALIAAGAGVKIAKHGNRAMSGAVGGADVLEALGVRIDLGADEVAACLEEVGMGFLFAPVFHPAMRHVAAPRREIGVRTIFNLLGPLSNPAGARSQLLGVFSDRWVEPLAEVLLRLGCQRALVVHGEDGLDEISLTGPTLIAEVSGGRVHTRRIAPGDFGLDPCRADEIQGGDARQNADLIRGILAGTAPRACQDIALLNAAAAVHVGGAAESIGAGLDRARESVASGRAAAVLESLIEYSNR